MFFCLVTYSIGVNLKGFVTSEWQRFYNFITLWEVIIRRGTDRRYATMTLIIQEEDRRRISKFCWCHNVEGKIRQPQGMEWNIKKGKKLRFSNE